MVLMSGIKGLDDTTDGNEAHGFAIYPNIPVSITGSFEGDPDDFDAAAWVRGHADEVKAALIRCISDMDIEDVAQGVSDADVDID